LRALGLSTAVAGLQSSLDFIFSTTAPMGDAWLRRQVKGKAKSIKVIPPRTEPR